MAVVVSLAALAALAAGCVLIWPAAERAQAALKPLTFAVWGDTRPEVPGSTTAARAFVRVARSLSRRSYSFSLGVGDYICPTASDSRTRIDAMYDAFLAAARPLRKSPVHYVPGNHELLGYGPARSLYHRRLRAPTPDWYQLTYGSLRILMLSSAEPGHEGTIGYYGVGAAANTAQADWLAARLKAIAAAAPRAWVLVVVHNPLHDPKPDDPWRSSVERRRLDALFQKYGVDAVLQGHVHNYRRHVAPNGITYLTQGTGGAPTRPRAYPPLDRYDRAAFGGVYGYTLLTRGADNSLRGVTCAASPRTWDFRVRDRFALTNRRAQ